MFLLAVHLEIEWSKAIPVFAFFSQEIQAWGSYNQALSFVKSRKCFGAKPMWLALPHP